MLYDIADEREKLSFFDLKRKRKCSTFYISPLSFIELVKSGKDFECKKHIAQIISKLFRGGVKILYDHIYCMMKHYKIRNRNKLVKEESIKRAIEHLAITTSPPEIFYYFFKDVINLSYQDIIMVEKRLYKLKEMIIQYYEGNIKKLTLSGANLDKFREDIPVLAGMVFQGFNEALLSEVQDLNISNINCNTPVPETLNTYLCLVISYVIYLIEQKANPRANDVVDLIMFSYLNKAVDVVITCEKKWKDISLFAGFPKVIEGPIK